MIDLRHMKGQTIAVFGLGLSGLAAAETLSRSGVEVWAWDDDENRRAALSEQGVDPVDLYGCDWRQVSALVLSPGIPHSFPVPHPVAQKAKEGDCPIIGDVELLVQAQRQTRFIGITGTNGKSTTTALIGHILQHSGVVCAVGGNLGIPALTLEALGPAGFYVLEMSSYQLELTPGLACDIAILLNISPDHLERHGGLDGYVQAKRLIFDGQSTGHTAIVGIDDPISQEIYDQLTGEEGRRVIAVSHDRPTDRGVYVLDGRLYDNLDGQSVEVADLRGLPHLPGRHNWQNAAAAYAACRSLEIDRSRIVAALESFPGLPHRQEQVAVIDGISFVNDSKATNGDAAAVALACYENIFWIAGGRAKEGGLAGLEAFFPKIAEAFLIGESADAFAKSLDGLLRFQICGELTTAVRAAAKAASDHHLLNHETEGASAPVVLLSPACASFDQFENFEKRGDAFRQAVMELAAERQKLSDQSMTAGAGL